MGLLDMFINSESNQQPSMDNIMGKATELINKHVGKGVSTNQQPTMAGIMNKAAGIMSAYNNSNTGSGSSQQPNLANILGKAAGFIGNAISAKSQQNDNNFDSPTFDPNAGYQDARNEAYNNYMMNLVNSGKKRINMKRANKEFGQYFDADWKAGEQDRKNQFITEQAQTRAQNLVDQTKQDMLNTQVQAQDDISSMYEQSGHSFDAASGNWVKNQTHGLDFNNVANVQQWLADRKMNLGKGGVDGKYGKDTKSAIDGLLANENSGLTNTDRQALLDFQNKNANNMVAHKQVAPPTNPVNNPQEVAANTNPTAVDPEKQKRIDAFTKAGYIKGTSEQGVDYYTDPTTKIKHFDNGRAIRNGVMGTTQADGTVRWDKFNFKNFGQDNNLTAQTIDGKQYYRYDPKGGGDFYVDTEGNIFKSGMFGALGDQIKSMSGHSGTNYENSYNDLYNKIHQNKNGGTMIKKHQQGGSMEQQEQQEFMKFLIEDALAQGLQIQTEDDVKSYLEQLGEEGIKAKYQQFMQTKGQAPKSKMGSKLNYIKQLKGDCPDGEELVYFKKGGMICSKCQKKEKGGEVVEAPMNAIQEFKKKRK